MTRHIRPLESADLPALSRFLTHGFHAPADADFAAPDVLRWKYLDPLNSLPADRSAAAPIFAPGLRGEGATNPQDPETALSLISCDETGQIIGHLGLCRTAFEGQGIAADSRGIRTIHIIDWLGSPEHRAVGMSLMRRAHQSVPTQFGLGVSPSALVVGERSGYELRALVPAFSRVVRPSYWRRTGLSPWQRALRLTRDAALGLIRPPAVPRPALALTLSRVNRFGPEIIPIIEQAYQHAVFTRRDPQRLNHMLTFPRQSVSGWHLVDAVGKLRGFALLNIIPTDLGRTRIGKVVDCVLDRVDPDLWHAAHAALLKELIHQNADIARAYGSTPWSADALHRAGYASRFSVKFHIRDRQALIPKTSVFHLTPLEGDYAYT
jgi:hypothetical protein